MQQFLSVFLTWLLVAGGAAAQELVAPEWITRSNADAQVLMEVYARFDPESAGRFGMAGLDGRVVDLGPARSERLRAAFLATARDLEARRRARLEHRGGRARTVGRETEDWQHAFFLGREPQCAAVP